MPSNSGTPAFLITKLQLPKSEPQTPRPRRRTGAGGAVEIYPSLPLVIASGQSKKELRRLFKDMALVGFVSKPYTAEELKN